MRNSKHTNPQIGYERTISRNKRYHFEGFALLAFAVLKSAFQLLAILAANRSASRILAQQWPNSRKAESREDKTTPNTPGRGGQNGRRQNGQRGSAFGKRCKTGKGEANLAGGQNGQGANSAGEGQSSMSDGLLSCLTAVKWATKKMKPERKAPAFERNPDRLRALGNPLRFSRTLANYETVNLAKIVISVLQYIHCRTVENFTRRNISCNSFIKRTRRLNTLFIGFELAL